MALLAGDIRFARSVNMSDVPEGGGPPSARLLNSGRSNEVFPDISEETRTVGRVEIYQIFSVLRNSDSTPLLGGNVILAEPPADQNVSVTMLSLKNPFATRADIAARIESGMSPGSEWNGYLLENHFTTMRSLTLLQRPGVTPPVIGRTYLLIYGEGQPSERRQRVRIKSTDTSQRIFTEVTDKGNVDFLAQVSTCEIFDGLAHDFPGSPPVSTFSRSSTKSLIRETVYSDSGMFYSATPLAQATAINDVWLKVASIYTQVVPNSRTEVVAIDQYPAARRTLVLAESPRRVEVGITPHTQRIRISEENAGTIYVALLKPLPAAGTVFIDFWALGQRYTLTDDGTGRMVGQGSGSVNYLTGALQLTLKSLPDIGSSITISHGESMAYTNRSGQAGYRAPEFAWAMPHQGIKPGSVVVTWMSGGGIKTATDNGQGVLAGTSGSGEIDYATGKIYLRPTAMIDAGGEFATDYEYQTVVTENFAAPGVDAGGFGSLTLASVPVAKSVTVRWITVRNVSASSGTSEIVSKSGTDVTAPPVTVVVPPTPSASTQLQPWRDGAKTEVAKAGETLTLKMQCAYPQTPGEYTWLIELWQNGIALDTTTMLQGGATGGAFTVASSGESTEDRKKPTGFGEFTVTLAAGAPDCLLQFVAKNQVGTRVAVGHVGLDGHAVEPPPPPPPPPPPAIKTREPLGFGKYYNTGTNGTSWAVAGMFYAGTAREQGKPLGQGTRMYVAVDASHDPAIGDYYDPPDADDAIWTESEVGIGAKQMTTINGISRVFIKWGQALGT